MKKTWKRLCTGFLALATVVTALPTTPVHAESKQYWTESAERVGIIEKVMNDGSIGSTFNEGYMKVEGETAYCIDINTDFKNGYKTRADASSRMSADQISDVALSLEYVKQYGEAHKELNYKQVYLLEQCVVWQRLSVHLGWQCDNVRASYDEIPKATQDEVFAGARTLDWEEIGMARRIVVANQKGGVGKTTTAVNLSAALREVGQRVLLVDFDPQGNATSGLGVDKNHSPNVYDVLIGESDCAKAIVSTPYGDVLPSNKALAGAGIELVGMEHREYLLSNALDTVEENYDFILIDCPPSLELLTLNGIVAARSVLIPVQCEYYALEGLSWASTTSSRRIHVCWKSTGAPWLSVTSNCTVSFVRQLSAQPCTVILP